MLNEAQCVCLVFFKFKGLGPKFKGFSLMQKGHSFLAGLQGLSFYKLLGTGRGNGFNPYPDFSTYSVLTVWENESIARDFLHSSTLIKTYKKIAHSADYFLMNSTKSHGEWAGENPFLSVEEYDKTKNIAVLTRAKIKLKHLIKFWRYVPTSSKPINSNEDILYTKGVGEIPLLNMATFSVWKNIDSMKKFAYNSKEHLKAIKMTRELDWYAEELFVRFVILEKGIL